MPVSTRAHLEALLAEQDKRMQVMADERSRALAIKDRADEKALDLAREIQTYKDEKANELRSQIESERGNMATKDDLAVAVEKVEAVRSNNLLNARTFAVALLAIVAGVLANAHVFG